MTVRIIGDGLIPEAKAFYDVRDALHFEQDIYLSAMLAKPFGIDLKDEVIYNLEPLYDNCRSFSIGYQDTLRRNRVLDYSKRNVEYLKFIGINAFHMPYGYHPSLERTKKAEKDIDVLFVGSTNPRRIKILSELQKHVNLVWANGVYGEDLDCLIAKAKVHVNVHFREEHPLEVVRLNYLMANHCTVVSELGDDEAQNKKYQDGVIFTNNLTEACLHALQHPLDGYDCIRKITHDCEPAREWLRTR